MKKYTTALAAALVLAACSGGKPEARKSAPISPSSNSVGGYLSGSAEVSPGPYRVESDNGMVPSWTAKVKIRITAAGDTSDYGLHDGNDGPLRLDVCDSLGTPLAGFDNLTSAFSDDGALADALGKGSGEVWVTFKRFADAGKPSLPGGSLKFIVSSSKVERKADAGNRDAGGDAAAPGSKDWDKLIDDYQAYMEQYIAAAKKAANGDQSAAAEYPGLMQKAAAVSADLSAGSGSMTPAQVSRFAEVQAKLTKEAAEIKAK